MLDVRSWTGSRQAEDRRVRDRVVPVLFDAHNDADIDLPFDVLTLDADDRFGQAPGPALRGEGPTDTPGHPVDHRDPGRRTLRRTSRDAP